MLGKQLATLGINGMIIRIMTESILVRRVVCKKFGFLNNVSIIFFIRPTVKALKRDKITGGER